jgi:hypothetical protein
MAAVMSAKRPRAITNGIDMGGGRAQDIRVGRLCAEHIRMAS